MKFSFVSESIELTTMLIEFIHSWTFKHSKLTKTSINLTSDALKIEPNSVVFYYCGILVLFLMHQTLCNVIITYNMGNNLVSKKRNYRSAVPGASAPGVFYGF